VFYDHFCARAERPAKVTSRNQRCNTFQVWPDPDSNSGGSDLLSNALPVRPCRPPDWFNWNKTEKGLVIKPLFYFKKRRFRKVRLTTVLSFLPKNSYYVSEARKLRVHMMMMVMMMMCVSRFKSCKNILWQNTNHRQPEYIKRIRNMTELLMDPDNILWKHSSQISNNVGNTCYRH